MNRAVLERAIAELAEGQWGLLTAAQARAAGVSRVELTRLVEDQVLTRLAHGVYVLRGAAGMEHLELRAAWLGLAPERMAADRLREPSHGAVVSHASAARLHQLGDLEADRHEFTVRERKQSRRSEVRLHRGVVRADEVVTVAGLPVTATERVVVDLLADRHDGEHVARVLAGAVTARTIDLERLTPQLGPFAARFGFPAGAGEQVLDYLLDLGGAADQVVADHLVSTARAANVGLVEIAQALSSLQPSSALVETVSPALVQLARAINALQTDTKLLEALREFAASPALTEIARAINALQTHPALLQAMQQMAAASASETRRIEERRALKSIEGTGV
jgi:predicted transcriptional regulator of viral defense system